MSSRPRSEPGRSPFITRDRRAGAGRHSQQACRRSAKLCPGQPRLADLSRVAWTDRQDQRNRSPAACGGQKHQGIEDCLSLWVAGPRGGGGGERCGPDARGQHQHHGAESAIAKGRGGRRKADPPDCVLVRRVLEEGEPEEPLFADGSRPTEDNAGRGRR